MAWQPPGWQPDGWQPPGWQPDGEEGEVEPDPVELGIIIIRAAQMSNTLINPSNEGVVIIA